MRPAETSVLELVELFHAKHFRHVLVVDHEDKLVGVVSDRDVLRCFGFHEGPKRSILAGIRVQELMSTDLVTVRPETPLEQAVTLMVEEGISCLPVLNEAELVGILTNTDLPWSCKSFSNRHWPYHRSVRSAQQVPARTGGTTGRPEVGTGPIRTAGFCDARCAGSCGCFRCVPHEDSFVSC